MTIEQDNDRALVLFSGGQDSATCLAWALARYRHVETIGFAYGQRHAVELACRNPSASRCNAALGPDHLVDLTATVSALGDTALTLGQASEGPPKSPRQPRACPTPSSPAATCCS